MMTTKIDYHKSQVAYTFNILLVVLRYVLWGALLLTAVTIASLNADHIAIHYFWGVISLPLYLALLTCLTVGWLIGIGIHLISHIKLHIYNRQLEARCQKAERALIRFKKNFVPEENDKTLPTVYSL